VLQTVVKLCICNR